MKRLRKISLLGIILLMLVACREERSVQPAFYHWKTRMELSPVEYAYLDRLGTRRLYVKFFDVEWDATREMPIPVAEVEITDCASYEIVPCVFITNRTFQNLSEDQTPWLAERVAEKLTALWRQIPHQTLCEVQFDCDWTATTRARFFHFLEIFKTRHPEWSVSATIRLHQFRDYVTTGVPPVDRGMLMCYNTGQVENWEEENSILNLAEAQHYLQKSRYPLPLDVALPVFAWGALFRDGRMIRLINNLRSMELFDTARFFKIANNRFEVRKSTYLNGYYLYEGDQIRTEHTDAQLLREAAQLLSCRIENRQITVSFYHLDTATIKHFSHEALESICKQFSR